MTDKSQTTTIPEVWKSLDTLLLDGKKIDVLAKLWRPEHDDFIFERFTNVWNNHSGGKVTQWHNVPKEYHVIAWMPRPEMPHVIQQN